jgi:hypothetical protein
MTKVTTPDTYLVGIFVRKTLDVKFMGRPWEDARVLPRGFG